MCRTQDWDLKEFVVVKNMAQAFSEFLKSAPYDLNRVGCLERINFDFRNYGSRGKELLLHLLLGISLFLLRS